MKSNVLFIFIFILVLLYLAATDKLYKLTAIILLPVKQFSGGGKLAGGGSGGGSRGFG